MQTDLAVLIPAAGASTRMRGRDKLMETVGGLPVLAAVVRRALGLTADVTVTLPPGPLAEARRGAIAAYDKVRLVDVADAQTGMSASFRAALPLIAGPVQRVLVVPADMPDITLEDMRRVSAAVDRNKGKTISRGATEDGRPGHPVCFDRTHFPKLAVLIGDQGARDVLLAQQAALVHVPLPGNHAVTDLDTPEDWSLWRAARGDPAL
ncbi:MAG: nucleotidyltransferase family protein [Pseudomonadota bacterium]